MVQECPLAKTHGGNLQRDLGENLLIQAMEEQLQLDTTRRILAGVILIWQNEAIRLLEDGVTPLKEALLNGTMVKETQIQYVEAQNGKVPLGPIWICLVKEDLQAGITQ
jgi:hypothetical protein